MLTTRNIGETIKEQLRVNAAKEGISMEEKAHRILRQALQPKLLKKRFATSIQQKVVDMKITSFDLPTRSITRDVIDFNND